MSRLVDIDDERFWDILFDEACVEGQQAERIQNELNKIANESVKGDLISRSLLLEEIEKRTQNLRNEVGNRHMNDLEYSKYCTLDSIYDFVADDFPTAYNDAWIPCSERLPEDGETVLVQDFEDYYEVCNCETKQGIKGFSNANWWSSANNYLAWQPLPAPYQPKGE